MGLKNFTLKISSLGDKESRKNHRVELLQYLAKLDLDEETRVRAVKNPLRIFDDKRETVRKQLQGAPVIMDYLSIESREKFYMVQEALQKLGISFEIDSMMVRGLDYYTGTAFEFVHHQLGALS